MTITANVYKPQENGGDIKNDVANGKQITISNTEKIISEGKGCCANILAFSLVYGLCSLTTQALTLYISSQITTIEKQYNLSSSESGIILSCNDIGFILTVLFFSHFGKRFHIPRILGVSVAIYGISGILSSLPQFISWIDTSEIDSTTNTSGSNPTTVSLLCDLDSNSTFEQSKCSTGSGSQSTIYKWIVVYLGICMAIQGVGKSPRSSLGTLYLDNNVEKTKTGLYLGIVQTFGLFGPFLALILGGLFGKIPVDLQDTDLTPEDPRWIGAWWIGFLMFGGLALLLAVPIAFFPRRIKNENTDEISLEEKKESFKENKDLKEDSIKNQTKDLPKALFRVFSNPVYIFHLLGLLCTMLTAVNLTSFGPKYMENQFTIPTWKANIILGGEKLITASVGIFLGGYLTSRLKLDRNGCLKMVAIIHVITSAVGSLHYIFGCENPVIIREHNRVSSVNNSIQSCHCQNVPYLAVCGSDGNNYFSPCHAGCVNASSNLYSGCSSIPSGEATSGLCDSGCPYLIPYVAVSVVQTLAATMAFIPAYLVFLRTVEERDRALGMGIVSFAMSLLVFIPGPIALGKLIDTTCTIWSSSCNEKGACALYDIADLRVKLISLSVILNILSFAFNVLTLMVAVRKADISEKSTNGIELKSVKRQI